MKRALIIAAMFILFSSCEKNDMTLMNTEVKFTIAGPVTRVTTVDNVTSFENNDVIAITSTGLLEDITAEEYTVTNDGLSGKDVKYNDEASASFIAHYPTSAVYDAGSKSVTFTVPAEQTAMNFYKNMFMVAENTGNPETPTVNLQFKHKLAWVKIVLNNIEGNSVLLTNVKPTATWTAQNLEASGEATEINAWKQGETQVYWVLVPQQTITAGSRLVMIETADKTFDYSLTEDLTLSSSKIKTITLSMTEKEKISAVFSVDNMDEATWEDEDTSLSGTVGELEIPAIQVITEDAGNFANVTELATGATGLKNITTDGWNAVINAQTSGTIALNQEDQCVEFTTNNGANWYNVAVVYRSTATVKAGTYTLSIDAKSEMAGELRFILASYDGQNEFNKNLYQTTTTEYPATPYQKTITINENYNGLLVAITAKTPANVKYSIKSVSLIEVK